MGNQYDLIIIGAGPAGLTASIYASRYRINHIIVGDPFSSLICEAHLVENWPGIKKISGLELIQKLVEQVKEYKVEIVNRRVIKIEKNNFFKIRLDSGQEFFAKSLIIATGSERKRLLIPGEKEFLGKGVSYCASCDAPFFKGKNVAVIGGANSALLAADLVAKYAKKVYLIYRGKEFRAEPILQEKIRKNKKIIPLFERNVIEIKGKEKIEEIVLDQAYKNKMEIEVDGLIIEIGQEPLSQLVKEIGVKLDESGLIEINNDCSTNISGVFAAGDVTTGSNKFRQAITAAAEGAIAALGVYNYLRKLT